MRSSPPPRPATFRDSRGVAGWLGSAKPEARHSKRAVVTGEVRDTAGQKKQRGAGLPRKIDTPLSSLPSSRVSRAVPVPVPVSLFEQIASVWQVTIRSTRPTDSKTVQVVPFDSPSLPFPAFPSHR